MSRHSAIPEIRFLTPKNPVLIISFFMMGIREAVLK